ncbi:hypothetical protein [Aromatoleum anaerobium]|uniref:Uncharacterized protein n=1 Tax=Aromatoleum anaerobium TaxID=182180 RepID=A0ABX1PQG6_9RHOO|nr:hypothetical protein [Aromatoleum anaerobium]MCK0506072.1 hypothetical protein [Aromatoleum anaerobium]
MVGIIFARPNSPLAKSEIIPQLNDWHIRSGDHIDFYFVGYTYPHPPTQDYIEVDIPGSDPWLYSAKSFNALRKEIESRTTWQYGGGCELLLTNARFDSTAKAAYFDFSSAICCQLDAMKTDHAIQSIERFFETVFRFAESANDEDPTWGFSDSQGVSAVGSALKHVVLGLLPKGLDAEYKKTEHFAVRNVRLR